MIIINKPRNTFLW